MHSIAFRTGKCEWKSIGIAFFILKDYHCKGCRVNPIAVPCGAVQKCRANGIAPNDCPMLQRKTVEHAELFHYNTTMLLTKRLSLSIALLLAIAFHAAAGSIWVDYRAGASFSFGGAFTIPTKDYLAQYPGSSSEAMPPVRTSYCYDMEVSLVGICIGTDSPSRMVKLGAGIAFTGTSRSLAYGASVLKAYNGVGAFVSFGALFDSLSLTTTAKLFKCRFQNPGGSFLACMVEVSPSMPVLATDSVKVSVSVPASIMVKADAVVPRLSCGVLMEYSVRGFEEGV